MPQSMQRAACPFSSVSGYGRYTSFQSRRRSVTGRAGGFLRLISRKPVTLPTRGAHELGEGRLASLLPRPRLGEEHPLVIARHDLHELWLQCNPVGEDAARVLRARRLDVTLDEVAHERDVGRLVQGLEIHHAEGA